ncbi:MAG: hypothetical protein RBU37_10280 [Myxococcota bacterium]|jgi:hypothetical protein|nr:hypothetical protein [Myxococcota bacterium]
MFDASLIEGKFEQIGARLQLQYQSNRALSLDIGRDRNGEFFSLRVNPRSAGLDALVMDVRPELRHLLLLFRGEELGPTRKSKFLCGHDERFWFVAALPQAPLSSDVTSAMEALKPGIVIASQRRAGVKRKDRNRRRNAGFVRQGEWFFVPEQKLVVPEQEVLCNEPLRRGAGKPHWAELAVRLGGETVWVSREHPNGLSITAYQRWLRRHQNSSLTFRQMRRNATLFVKGRISHPDHRTIKLPFWHRVVLNREGEAPGTPFVAFLD